MAGLDLLLIPAIRMQITIDVIVVEVSDDAPPEKGFELEELMKNAGYVFDGGIF